MRWFLGTYTARFNRRHKYFGQRLQTIWNRNTDGSTLSKFDYAYDALGNITNWTQQAGTTATNVWLA